MPAERDEQHVPRDERRRRTETAILDAARGQFADAGFERTTIRSVAGAAGVDPALVMQHFGSKERLFAEAARWPEDASRVLQASRSELPRAALDDLFERFEGADRQAAVALMRNCLTHPQAVRVMREDVLCDRVEKVAAAIGGDDAELRGALLGACLMGLAIARHLLEVEPVASASRAEVERLLEPALRALVDPPTAP